jgi:hypothetical protein
VIGVPVIHVPFVAVYIVVGHPPEQTDPDVQVVGAAEPADGTLYPTAAPVHKAPVLEYEADVEPHPVITVAHVPPVVKI